MTNDQPESGFEQSGRLFLVSFAKPPHDITSAREVVMMKEFLCFLIKHKMITVAPELESLDILKKVILDQYQKEIDQNGLKYPELDDEESAELLLRLDPCDKELMDVLLARYDEFKFVNNESLQELAKKIRPDVMFGQAFKIRGTAPNTVDGHNYLKQRAKLLGDTDANFDVSAGEMYKWLPFDPDVSHIQDQTTRDARMNDILRGYMENQQEKAEFLEKLRQEEIKKMSEKNRVRKEQQREQRKKEIMEKLQEGKGKEEEEE